MDRHRDRLAEDGIGYWSAGQAHAQLLKCAVGLATEEEISRRHKRASSEKLLASLHAELDSCETFVLSGENLSSLLPDEIKVVREVLSSRGAEVTGVFYVREPRARRTSGTQQRLKTGSTIASSLARERDHPAMRLDLMVEGFGSDLQIRAYRGRSLVPDFLQTIGLDPETAASLNVEVKNEALSHHAAVVQDAVLTRAEQAGTSLRDANALAQLLTRELPGPRFQLPPEVHEAFVATDRAEIDRMSELLGEDVLALPTTVAPPPDVPPVEPGLINVIYGLAKERGEGRAERQKARRNR